jgi:hydrogenase maturation protease
LTRERQILVAGIGNAFLGDDGFGGNVAQALEKRELPSGVKVFDFGTGGLDLAYEVMRGYDALVLVDVSRQGEPPGTLYVMEPDADEIEGGIEDGAMIDPHGMDPQTVLRFVKAVGGWPGRVLVIACEPTELKEMQWGLSEPVEAAVERAVELVLKTVEELRSDAAYAEG